VSVLVSTPANCPPLGSPSAYTSCVQSGTVWAPPGLPALTQVAIDCVLTGGTPPPVYTVYLHSVTGTVPASLTMRSAVSGPDTVYMVVGITGTSNPSYEEADLLIPHSSPPQPNPLQLGYEGRLG
jgi:hypothetical protein